MYISVNGTRPRATCKLCKTTVVYSVGDVKKEAGTNKRFCLVCPICGFKIDITKKVKNIM